MLTIYLNQLPALEIQVYSFPMTASSDKSAFPMLRPASLRVNVADLLRAALFQRRYRPGDELTDSALAEELGVSRGPVREALIILAEEGLIEHRHYRGFRVPSLQAEDILQINEARFPLEVLSLKLAQSRAMPKSIAALSRLKEDLLKAHSKSTDDMPLTARPDFDFHSYIWELSGNPWLVAGLRRICLGRFLYVSARSLGFAAPDETLMDEAHQQYIDYVSGSSSLSAEDCVAQHLKLYDKQ